MNIKSSFQVSLKLKRFLNYHKKFIDDRKTILGLQVAQLGSEAGCDVARLFDNSAARTVVVREGAGSIC